MSSLPYYKIPDSPSEVTAASILLRVIDGLGFRYRWSTEGLSIEDYEFQPSHDSMTMKRLLRHIYGLTIMIYQCISGRESTLSDTNSLEEIRRLTLDKILQIREILLRMSDEELAASNVLHSRRGKFPFWYMINGPLCDALTHVGQIASWRRINGNPIPRVSVFFGKHLEK